MFSASNTKDNPVNSHTPHPAKNSCTACVTLLTMWLCSLGSDAVYFGTCPLSHTTSRPRRPVFFFFFFFHVFRNIIFASLYGGSQYFLEYRSTRCHIERLTRKYFCSKSTYFESLPKHQPSSLNKPQIKQITKSMVLYQLLQDNADIVTKPRIQWRHFLTDTAPATVMYISMRNSRPRLNPPTKKHGVTFHNTVTTARC